MSGFEAIGLVLGIWPLVVNGLQIYKAAKNGQGWDLLCDEFRVEEYIYVDCVRHLLAADVSEGDLLQLTTRDKPNQHLWKDPMLHKSLEKRLGPERSTMVLKTLQEMDTILSSLAEKFTVYENTADSSHSKITRSIHKIKFALPQASMKESLRKLREYNARLQRLLTNCTSSGYPAQGRLPKTSPRLAAGVLRKITTHANELHDAIYEGFNCPCRNPHEARLRMYSPDDIDLAQPFELVFPVDENTAKQTTQLDQGLQSPTGESIESFEFDTLSNISSRRWSHRDSLEALGSPITSISGTSPPPIRGRSISVSRDNGLENGGLIDDLCEFIKRLGDESATTAPASCLGVLGRKNKNEKYAIKVTSLDGDPSQPASLVCLDDYLSTNQKWDATRKKRMDLALSLSLAILQFYTTPWIDMWWTWKDFCMMKGDKSQIFITKRFYSTHSPLNIKSRPPTHPLSTSTFWDCYGEPVLTRLGFALVELALGQRLSDMRQGECVVGEDEDMLDLMTAKQLVEEGRVLDEAGQCYHDAVQACLTHQVITDTEVKGLNSKHVNFQSDVEKFVVAPIRDSYAASWGHISVS